MSAKLISYDGKFPHRCCGVMVAEINGRMVSFGWNFQKGLLEENYTPFVTNDDDCGRWVLYDHVSRDRDPGLYPDEIWEAIPSLLEQMKEKYEAGHCGGCE